MERQRKLAALAAAVWAPLTAEATGVREPRGKDTEEGILPGGTLLILAVAEAGLDKRGKM
jgi:hypothetical protein